MSRIIISQKLTRKLAALSGQAEIISRQDADILGQEIVSEMNNLISKGISPIEGGGRFPGYKHQGVKGKYPASAKRKHPAKRDRPVNLYLSGKFEDGRKYKVEKSSTGYGVVVGYFDKVSQEKEEGHASGENGQPRRPTIPTGSKKFSVSIQNLIRKSFREAVKRVLSR